MPDEAVDLYLCRYVYHCTPSQLDQEDAERIEKHLILLDVESKVAERSRKK